MLKILYICKDFTNWIGHGHLAFKKALAKVADVTFYHESCDVNELLARFRGEGKTFDLIMLGEAPPVTPPVKGLRVVSLPKVVHYWDVHVLHQERLLFVKENKIDLVIVKFKEGTKRQFPQLLQTAPCAWLPVAVDTATFRDYRREKTIEILLTGALSPHVYPLRLKYLTTFRSYPGFVHVAHPGYKHFEPGTAVVGKEYAMMLNSAKVCPTSCSVYKYSIQKHFEIPASYSLLAAPFFSDLDELGFIPDENFLSVTPSDFEEKIFAILRDEERLVEMTKKGAKLVRRYHSVNVRARQFVNLVCRVLLGRPAPFENLQEFTL